MRGIIYGAASAHADDLHAPAEAIRLIDLALTNLFEARDFGGGARRLDQRALQVTIVGSRLERKERKERK